MARAGTGDLADARALIATGAGSLAGLGTEGGVAHALRTVSIDDADRESVVFRLSAALGRAWARADRGRTLALRGGDVTALVPLATLDDVTDRARSVVPIAAMLDSHESTHVP
jgi:hypothetical protein